MIRKLILMATAAMAMFAVGAQSASANWYHGQTPLVGGQNPHITATGPGGFTSPNGGVNCPSYHWTIQLTGGTTTGHVLSSSASNPTACEISGGLVFLTGGTTSLKSATLTPGAQIHIVGDDVQLTGVSTHTEFHNGFKLTLNSIAGSPLTGTVDNTQKITTITFHGNLASAIGNIACDFHLHIHNPTYGITPF